METKTVQVFHGTTCCFNNVDLRKTEDYRDFGVGFYTTTSATVAESWARAKKKRSSSSVGEATVMVFEASLSANLKFKRFPRINEEWLEFIRWNRINVGTQHNYDVVIGPFPDDEAFVIVSRYLSGTYTAKEVLLRLKDVTTSMQISFHTDRSVECLKLERVYKIG